MTLAASLVFTVHTGPRLRLCREQNFERGRERPLEDHRARDVPDREGVFALVDPDDGVGLLGSSVASGASRSAISAAGTSSTSAEKNDIRLDCVRHIQQVPGHRLTTARCCVLARSPRVAGPKDTQSMSTDPTHTLSQKYMRIEAVY